MVGLRRLIPTATAKEIIMDSHRYNLQYELDLIEETLKQVENRQIWWLEEEEITELKKRKRLLEILL
jgi:uncharacterized Zn finger protein